MTKRTIPLYPTREVKISNRTEDPISELKEFIRQCSEPSFDRWTNIASLEVVNVVVTRPLLNSMIEFMNLPFAKDPTGTGDQEFRWIRVRMKYFSWFAQRHNTRSHVTDKDCCTPDDIYRLFSAITHRALDVSIVECPKIVSDFLTFGHQDYFEVESLRIDQETVLSALECSVLSRMIQGSVDLKKLYLRLPFGDFTHEVVESFANLVQLCELHVEDAREQKFQQEVYLADLLVGDLGDGAPLLRLLRNPQNQLKKLSVMNTCLNDSHLTAILQMKRISQIEYFDFRGNSIRKQGMLEFANLLPKMRSLKYVEFRSNPWKNIATKRRRKVGAALLQGLMENTSIETMHGIEHTPQASLLENYIALNRAGRRLLASSQLIPDGLWPIILERAGNYLSFTTSYKNDDPIRHLRCHRANVLYYFFHNCPRIFNFRS